MAEKTDLKKVYDALIGKRERYTTYNRYYNGDQPLRYSSERLKDAFDDSSVKFIQNWCSVIIDAVLDRLVFKGWNVDDKTVDKSIDDFYNRNNVKKISADVHENALVTGESFIVFDKVDDQLRGFQNDSRLVQLFYSADNPEVKTLGAKWWVDPFTELNRLNLYYPDRIVKYKGLKTVSSEKSFTLDEEVSSPFGDEIPIIRFDRGYSELASIITLQDAINKTFSDMMVVGEFNAFKQRWMITNADISALKNNPRSFYQIPKGASDEESTQVGEFTAADLTKFLEVMDKLANSIAVITRTPKHYFMDTGANISGEALIAMESPLVKKVQKIQENFSTGWKDCARFILKQSGKQVDVTEITTIWGDIETKQPLLKAQEMESYLRMGVPLETVLKRAGWGADEIQQMLDDKKRAKLEQSDIAKQTLEILRLRDQQDNAE
jgi:hypothetical protein